MAALIEHDTYFTSLPRRFYVSAEIFERELTTVLASQWLYAGHVSMVPEPGDYYVRQVGSENMIITRDDDGRLHAFFNVCRHRGARVCDSDTRGHGARRLTCPYHQWSYGLDGSLRSAPGSRDGADFTFADWGLHEAHCDVYFGCVFVHLGRDEPESLETVLSAVTSDVDRLAVLDPVRTKVAHREVYDVAANWKAMLENNCECYHCAGSHPTLCYAWDYRGAFLDEDGQLMVEPGLYVPLREGMQTFSVDGRWVCDKPLGGAWQEERFSAGYILTPNYSGLVYFADHGVALTILPQSAGQTQLLCEWYVHEDAVEGVDYDVQRLIGAFHQTNLEDTALAARNQLGVNSTRFTPGPNSARREPRIKVALSRYLELLGDVGDLEHGPA